MSRVLSLAGFEVTLIGRFWVIPEGKSLKIRMTTSSGEPNNQPRKARVRGIKIQVLGGNSYMEMSLSSRCKKDQRYQHSEQYRQ